MEQIGFKLIKVDDNMEIESWGGIIGQCPSPPTVIFLPGDTQVFCPEINVEYYGYRLTEWYTTASEE